MPEVPIINGIYTDSAADFRVALPVNLVPVPTGAGISRSYLRPGDGLVELGIGPGVDRGGIEWRGQCYRVMGSRLVRIEESGAVTDIGYVGIGGLVTFDYSFDYLAIASAGNLFLYDGSTLQEVTDPDLSTVRDVIWIDGYFMTTDGQFLVVTELNNPFSVDPLKYGSSEIDPDAIQALIKFRNEVYALNRHTIEVYDNTGASGFPFQRNERAVIQKGVVGTHACCVMGEAIAFLGGARNEAPAIYLGASGEAQKISTREIDTLLQNYTEDQLSEVLLEARLDRSHQYLYVHLPDRTLVYDAAATGALQTPVWFVLTSTLDGFARYQAQNFVWCYNQWLCGDPTTSRYGRLSDDVSHHYGQRVRWEFATPIVYNAARGAVFHAMELTCLTGNVALGADPYILTSYSADGRSWSVSRRASAGKIGNTTKRVQWRQMGFMQNWRVQRFQGDSDAHVSIARLEATFEPLAV